MSMEVEGLGGAGSATARAPPPAWDGRTQSDDEADAALDEHFPLFRYGEVSPPHVSLSVLFHGGYHTSLWNRGLLGVGRGKAFVWDSRCLGVVQKLRVALKIFGPLCVQAWAPPASHGLHETHGGWPCVASACSLMVVGGVNA